MNLMIIDDDINIRDGIRYGIDWKSLGIEEVKSYSNALDALDDFPAFEPQIILVDIRMPEMSGLEFLDQVKKIAPSAKIILISAYSDFEYCREALRLGASRYELKPLKVRSLIKSIQEMIDEILTENLGKEYLNKYRDSYKTATMENILKGAITDRNIILDFFQKFYSFTDMRQLSVAVLSPDINIRKKRTTAEDDQNLIKTIQDYINETQLVFPYQNQLVILTLLPDSARRQSEIQNQLKLLYHYINNPENTPCSSISMGISEPVPADQISLAYDSACTALARRFFDGAGSFESSAFSKKTAATAHGELSPFPLYAEGFQQGNIEKMLSGISQTENFLLQFPADPDSIAAIRRMIQNEVTKIKNKFSSNVPTDVDFSEYRFFHELISLWKELVISYKDLILLQNTKDYSRHVQNLIAYIHENYQKNITLKDAAEYLQKSPNYFSSIFHQEVGMTFREYLNKYRVEQASMLLSTTDLRIYEIAELVGYRDYTYFSQVFKKYMGEPPTALYRGSTPQN